MRMNTGALKRTLQIRKQEPRERRVRGVLLRLRVAGKLARRPPSNQTASELAGETRKNYR
jgi:hypothetical protein